MVGKPWQQGCEGMGHNGAQARKQTEMKAGTQPVFSSLFCLGPQAMGWCHSHSAWVFPVLLKTYCFIFTVYVLKTYS